MLSTFQLVFCFVIVLVLFPLIVTHLYRGSSPSSGGPLRKYQLAEPRLELFANLFVLGLCLIALNRLVQHFGLIDTALADRIDATLNIPFLLLFFVFLALLAKAMFKVHGSSASSGS